ncbi:MAG: hypothetical protein MHM6MM_000834 [Cercozoa sp. M6MM]
MVRIVEQALLCGNNALPSSLRFRPHHTHEAAFASAGNVAVCDTRSGAVMLLLRAPKLKLRGDAEAPRITCLSWLDADRLICGDSHGRVLVFSVPDRKCLASVQHPSEVCALKCYLHSDQSVHVAVAHNDGTLAYAQVASPDALIELAFITVKSYAPRRLLCLDFACFRRRLVLAAGGMDGHVRFYTVSVSPSASVSPSVPMVIEVAAVRAHDDWVRGLHFLARPDELLLASASQDRSARVWQVHVTTDHSSDHTDHTTHHTADHTGGHTVTTDANTDVDILADLMRYETRQQLHVRADASDVADAPIRAEARALLQAHEDWVTDVQWRPGCEGKQLLTCSMDGIVSIWHYTNPEEDESYDDDEDAWHVATRLCDGDGFFGACFRADGRAVFAMSSALHLWEEDEEEIWHPRVVATGHSDEVRDLAFLDGVLLSVSKDSTTRLWAPSDTVWREIARPQVHGHELRAIVPVPTVPLRFVSGGAEKVLRVFDAPRPILEDLRTLCGIIVQESNNDTLKRAERVVSPELGLSNKAQQHGESVAAATAFDTGSDEAVTEQARLTEPPRPTQLTQRLFGESQKLFGHSFEIQCLASARVPSSDRVVVVSASAARNRRDAAIRVWSVKKTSPGRSDARQLQVLPGPTLTATALALSPCASWLVAVSRDRHLYTYRRSLSQEDYKLVPNFACNAHSRTVLCTAFAPSNESNPVRFVTGARDKCVKLWQHVAHGDITDTDGDTASRFACVASVTLSDAVTALAFVDTCTLLAGLESGRVAVLHIDESKINDDAETVTDGALAACMFGKRLCPSGAIRRLLVLPTAGTNQADVAVAANDHSVRVWRLLDLHAN